MLTHLLPPNPLDLFLRLSLAGLLLLTLSMLLTTTLLRRSSAATRHLIWTATTLALLCLPAFALLPPAQPDAPPYLAPLPRLAPLPALELNTLPTTDPLPAPAAPRFTFHVFTSSPFLLSLYSLGLLLSLTPLLLGPLLLHRLRSRATVVTDPTLLSTLNACRQTLSLPRPVCLLLSPSPTAMPLAFGLLRPHILLPADAPTWPPARLRLVLSHELAHIKRHDVLTLCLAQLARAVHWFNPLAYLAVSRMLTERERACDDLVLASTATRPSDYADTLLHLSTTLGTAPTLLPAMPMSRGPSHLHTRLRAILNPTLNRSPLTRRLTIAALLLAPTLALPLSCSRADKSQPPVAGTQRVPSFSDHEVDQYGWTPEMNAAQGPMRDIVVAAGSYANKHDGHLPPTLGDTLPYVDRNHAMSRTDRRHATPAEKARAYLDPRDYASVTLPETPTPDWVNAHTSYTYLGRSDVNIRSLTEDQFGKTILLHDSLDHPHRNPKVGPLVICAYLDGHSEGLPVDAARKQIEASQQTLAAAAAGKAAPPQADRQNLETIKAASNLRQLGQSILLYANEHQNYLPPDLGATFPFTAVNAKTPAEAARVYLAPPHNQEVPANPTPDWINKHTSYTYLGSPAVRLYDIPADPATGRSSTILAHSDLARPYDHPKHGPVITALYGDGHTELLPLDVAKQQIAQSQQTLANTANGGAPAATKPAVGPNAPWPADLAECATNLRDLTSAVTQYTETHDRHYPADLGPTIDLVAKAVARQNKDHRQPTAAELARKYLCPLLARNVHIPDRVTPDWVNKNATYTYLGSDKIRLGDFTDDEWSHTVIFHDDLDHPHKHPHFGTVTIVAYLDSAAQLLPVAEARKQIEASKKTLAEVAKRKSRTDASPQPSTPGQSAAQRSAAPDSSNPQSAIANPQSHAPIPFDLGTSSFLPGDSIKIDHITREAAATNNLPGGGIFTVHGAYTLASRDSATLGLYVTSDNPNAGVGSATHATKGTHPFSLRYAQSGPGHPHLSFYPAQGGSSFGTLYFGSGPTLLKAAAPQTTSPNDRPVTARIEGAGQTLTVTPQGPPAATVQPSPDPARLGPPTDDRNLNLTHPPAVFTGGTLTTANGRQVTVTGGTLKISDTPWTGSSNIRPTTGTTPAGPSLFPPAPPPTTPSLSPSPNTPLPPPPPPPTASSKSNPPASSPKPTPPPHPGTPPPPSTTAPSSITPTPPPPNPPPNNLPPPSRPIQIPQYFNFFLDINQTQPYPTLSPFIERLTGDGLHKPDL